MVNTAVPWCLPVQGCPEDTLTPDALLHGYRHREAAAVGFTVQRELALTLTDQPHGFYNPSSLAYWRKVRQGRFEEGRGMFSGGATCHRPAETVQTAALLAISAARLSSSSRYYPPACLSPPHLATHCSH